MDEKIKIPKKKKRMVNITDKRVQDTRWVHLRRFSFIIFTLLTLFLLF